MSEPPPPPLPEIVTVTLSPELVAVTPAPTKFILETFVVRFVPSSLIVIAAPPPPPPPVDVNSTFVTPPLFETLTVTEEVLTKLISLILYWVLF